MNNKYVSILFHFTGFLLVAYSLFILLISPDFTYAAKPAFNDILGYSIVRIIIGVFYSIATILIIKKAAHHSKSIIFIFFVGIVARLVLVFSQPILEDDFNRYLWDGAVTVNGFNPYIYAPKDYLDIDSSYSDSKSVLDNLAIESGVIVKRINHPHIRTIYPPVAQIIFGISYLIEPWSISVWKAVLVLIDVLVFILLLVTLKKIGYPLILVLVYWWNPILLHEIFNAGHMDLLIYPFILLAIIYYLRNNYLLASIFVAISVGIKIWPIIFLPLIYRKLTGNKKLLLTTLIVSFGVIIVVLFPIILTKFDDSLGFVTYSKNWTNNEAVFQLVNWSIKQIINLLNVNYHCSLCATRWVTVGFFAIIIIYFTFQKPNDDREFIKRLFLLVGVLYLISPTQFPWYYTWILPLLVMNPRISFIVYTITLPLYQLKYSIPYLVWVEHFPILILFLIEIKYPQWGNYLINKLQIKKVNSV